MPNYRYFSSFLSHLNPTVWGEIFGWTHQLPRSKMFYPTLNVCAPHSPHCKENLCWFGRISSHCWIFIQSYPDIGPMEINPNIAEKLNVIQLYKDKYPGIKGLISTQANCYQLDSNPAISGLFSFYRESIWKRFWHSKLLFDVGKASKGVWMVL